MKNKICIYYIYRNIFWDLKFFKSYDYCFLENKIDDKKVCLVSLQILWLNYVFFCIQNRLYINKKYILRNKINKSKLKLKDGYFNINGNILTDFWKNIFIFEKSFEYLKSKYFYKIVFNKLLKWINEHPEYHYVISGFNIYANTSKKKYNFYYIYIKKQIKNIKKERSFVLKNINTHLKYDKKIFLDYIYDNYYDKTCIFDKKFLKQSLKKNKNIILINSNKNEINYSKIIKTIKSIYE